MNFNSSYILPFILALGLHAIVVLGMVRNWQDQSSIVVTPVEKYYIQASVVRENPHEIKKRQQEEMQAKARARQRQIEARREAERQAEIRNQLATEKEEEEKKEELELVEIPPVDEVLDNQESELITEEERKRMEQDLALEIREEQEYRRAITDDEKAMAYVALIQQEIIRNWSRPPSARNGMEALLRVRLVPTGEVVDVSIEKSSGNDAFDRSAVLAVQKAERFPVPDSPRQFEKNFREFTVLFRPEDLRL